LVDPARLHDYSRYKGGDILTPNREELSIVAGRRFASLEPLATAAQELIEALDARAMVVTVDRDGAVLVQRDEHWHHIPTVPRSVYDNTGAGDAVLAMLAASVAAGADLKSATRLANIAGGLEVEKFGCVPITADEVPAEIRLEDRAKNGKLRGVDELVAELQLRRDRGETVAFTNGCFDILHAGHVVYLERAANEGDLLVVGINSDASVRQVKGKDRPIVQEADRALVVASLRAVDYVTIFTDPSAEAILEALRPDVYVKGGDYTLDTIHQGERRIVEGYGGRIAILPGIEGRSTSEILERVTRANESER
ncbi:MAG: bifunctional heptose 7-phosphate kinase/heptose 1-phosphate adenyltransferase, partial [Candidatus Hydrogenedentes bacterium]|nr:bifunctional heptose 7-phosphate kinase/heptose 1-phosphate adenyltransferase [Candidatus Hydrogenedentota bacterium]